MAFFCQTATFLVGLVAIAEAGHPRVEIQNGSIKGKTLNVSNATANAYLGIPFAKPPTRFLAPEAAGAIYGEYDGTKYKSSCMQTGIGSVQNQYYGNTSILDEINSFFYNPTNSEDCLYLDVYIPLNATSASKLPVLFNIYGGNLQSGSGSIAVYNGVPFAAHQNVIVVMPNYRVGVFGFTASPELTQKNLGFLDQRLALSWVHENIVSFGGDPEAITLGGQSAGAYSVKQLWLNPPSPLTFRAAIMQSQTLSSASDGWPALTQLLNCSMEYSPLACVQAVDAETIVTISRNNSLTFPPTVDHFTFTDHVETAIAKGGAAANIYILMGTNGNEAAFLLPGLTPDVVTPFWVGEVNSTTPAFEDLYNATVGNWKEHTSSHVYNQYEFTCRTAIVSTRAAENGMSIWRYFFNATFPEWDSIPGESTYGAYHGSELPLLFGTLRGDIRNAGQVSTYLQNIFGSFVRNPSSGLSWPAVNSVPEYLLKIDNESGGGSPDVVISNGVTDADCGLVEALLISTGVV